MGDVQPRILRGVNLAENAGNGIFLALVSLQGRSAWGHTWSQFDVFTAYFGMWPSGLTSGVSCLLFCYSWSIGVELVLVLYARGSHQDIAWSLMFIDVLQLIMDSASMAVIGNVAG